MKKRKWITVFFIALIAIQFIRPDQTNPEIIPGEDLLTVESADKTVEMLLKDACYDCHSNNTEYPWYSNVAPVSWWMKRHVNKGRAAINFSKWSNYTVAKKEVILDECIEFVEKGWMPIGSFKIMHPEARITDEDRQKLVNWFQSIM